MTFLKRRLLSFIKFIFEMNDKNPVYVCPRNPTPAIAFDF